MICLLLVHLCCIVVEDDIKDDVKIDDDENEKEKKLGDNDKPVKDETKTMVKEEPSDGTMKAEDGAAAEVGGGGTADKDKKTVSLSLADAVRDEMDRLMEDNKRLQNTVTEIHQCHRELTLKVGKTLLSRMSLAL